MRIVTEGGDEFEIGTVEATPTITIADYSRRETDEFGVTTVVKRDFSRRMSVRMALPTDEVDQAQRLFAALRASPAQWIADDRFAWLSPTGFYKDFELDLAVPPLSFCTLTIEGLAESEPGPDGSGDPAPAGSTSTLRQVRPQDIDDDVLAASSVDEFDHPQWVAGTTYAAGARVLRLQSHRIWESAAAGNIGQDPVATTGHWIDIGATNRWAMFDEALGTATTAAGAISVTLDVAGVDAIAALDVVADTIRVQAPGYDVTRAASAGALTFLDLPVTTGAITVTISGAEVSVGTLLVGTLIDLGVTEEAPTAGINDYSRKETDEFGEVTVVERAWAKRMSAKALIRTDAIDDVANRVAAVRGRPCLWIGDEDLDSLTVYGFYKDFSIEVGETVSKVSLTIEGLSQAAPRGSLTLTPGWTDIVDDDPVNHPKPQDGADVTGENTSADTNAVGGRPATDVLADLAAIQALAAGVQEQADALAGMVNDWIAEIEANAIAIETIDTTVAAHSSTIALHGSAIAGLTGDLATVSLKVSAGARNLVKNSGFEDAFTNWTFPVGSWSLVTGTAFGSYAVTASTGSPYFVSDRFAVQPLLPFTASADIYLLGHSAGAAYIQLAWYDADGVNVGFGDARYKSTGGWTTDRNGRVQVTNTAPAGAVFGRVLIAGEALAGAPSFAAREIKVENAAFMSPFSQEASVITTFTALSGLNGQYASLSSTVATLGSQVSSSATAITDLNTNVATLTSRVSAGSINLVKNSSFERGLANWTHVGGAWGVAVAASNWGAYAVSPVTTNTYKYIFSDRFEVENGRPYVASADMGAVLHSGSATIHIYLLWYDASDVNLSSSAATYGPIGETFHYDLDGRTRTPALYPPAGATGARVIVVVDAGAGSATGYLRQVKVEQGFAMSRWTQEASVFQQAQAISTAEGQISYLSSLTATQGSQIASNATAISGVAGDLATLTVTVSTNTASIETTAEAISSLSGDFASLSSVVATLGSSVSIQLSAIAGINGQLSARYGIVLEAGTGIARMTAMASGGSSSWKFESDEFEISAPGGGARTAYSDGNWRVYYSGGGLACRMGVW